MNRRRLPARQRAARRIDDSHFWYRKSVKGGNQFVIVDAEAQSKPAFDCEKLAASLSAASGGKFDALKLPFQEIAFASSRTEIEFAAAVRGGDARSQTTHASRRATLLPLPKAVADGLRRLTTRVPA